MLLSFRLNDNALIDGGPGGAAWWDKVPSKFAGWDEQLFREAGFRAVPGAIVRHSAYIARDAVLMPSFVNLGAYVGAKTMVDTWVTVGSCAQIGANVHLSGGVGIGGVLEPLQANPTIIEDDCFIGARSEVVEGVVVGQGLGRVDGRVHLRLDQDHRPRDRQGPCRLCAALFRRRLRLAARQAAARRLARPVALLRRDRQDRRRADPRQDRHQRPPERLMAAPTFRFLYRETEGAIGPGLWARASAWPVGIALAMTALAWAIAPGPRDLATQPFFSLSIVAVHAYFIVYGFALICARRRAIFRQRQALRRSRQVADLGGAGAVRLLLAGAAAWFQPRSEGAMPEWAVWPFYALAAGVVIWNIAELGFARSKSN